jgi:hypothetical protein
MQRHKLVLASCVGLAFLFLAACTAGDPRFTMDNPAGFFEGLWHGVISLITLVVSLFSENVRFYEVDNTGWGYDAGFLLGMLLIYGGGGSGIMARRRGDLKNR